MARTFSKHFYVASDGITKQWKMKKKGGGGRAATVLSCSDISGLCCEKLFTVCSGAAVKDHNVV